MTITVKHNKTNAIADWTQADLDAQIALGNFPAGTLLANIVLPSDWNDDHDLTGLGTMAEQDADAVAIAGGSINNTPVGATTPSTGKFTAVTTPSVTATTNDLTLSAISTGAVNLNTAGGEALKAVDNGTIAGSAYWVVKGSSGGFPTFGVDGTNPNIFTTIYSKGTVGTIRFATNTSTQQMQIAHTASAVNFVQVTGAATGSTAKVTAQGSDSNVPLYLTGKGASDVNIGRYLTIGADTANNAQIIGSTTTLAPRFTVTGSDTNISMAFQPKGTGAINLAAGSSGVNISNGGTVTAITITVNGITGYTSHPTPAISAPTTAGGVQATATTNLFYNSAIATTSIVNGGTGYAVGNVLTVVGGTFVAAATFTVATVSGGVITGITSTTGGTYSVIPTGTLSVTGGSGTGFTLTINGWAIRSLNITNAGSGYIEQPTVTFSGGGGSGAAAYATVGSATIIRSMAGTPATASMSFHTPSSITSNLPAMRIMDGAAGYDTYVTIQPAAAYTTISAVGNSGANLFLNSTGAGSIRLMTGGNSLVEQMRVTNTASAVNYVQVTGGSTTNNGIISTAGSDTNVGLTLQTKGTGSYAFITGGGRQVDILNVASAVNRMTLIGSAAGSSPTISVVGTDTNIDLALTPKGTGGIVGNINSGTFAITRDSINNAIKFTATNAANLHLQSTGGGSILFNTADSLLTQARISSTASAVNYVNITGAATTATPRISAQGSDANISIGLQGKGTGAAVLLDSDGFTTIRAIQRTASGDTFLDFKRDVGFVDLIASSGVTDGDIRFTPKGAGLVRFGTYTAGATLATGYINIKAADGTTYKVLVST
jgi:hypothetical protein